VGGNPSPTVRGQGQLPSTSNYFVGSDPSTWQQYVPNYSGALVENVYPGIDVVFSGTDARTLEYTFLVHPGADPAAIRLAWEGVSGVATDQPGTLDLATADGTLVQTAPTVYQATADGTRQTIPVSTTVGDDGSIGFQLGAYDASRELILDPVLPFSSLLGG